MKKFRCEMCGSGGFIKDYGVFVCQNCGLKYSLETAQKILTKGEPFWDENDAPESQQNELLLRRAMLYLGDEDWTKAVQYLEQVLDGYPESSLAYVGKLMADLKCRTMDQLKNYPESFETNKNFQMALRFGDEQLRNELMEIIDSICTRNKDNRRANIYGEATSQMRAAKDEYSYRTAAAAYGKIPGYKDADLMAQQCLEKAESAQKDKIHTEAEQKQSLDTIDSVKEAKKIFVSIKSWKDANARVQVCQARILELDQEEKDKEQQLREAKGKGLKERIKQRKLLTLCFIVIIILLVVGGIISTYYSNVSKYNNAMELYNAGRYIWAAAEFDQLGDFLDAQAMAATSRAAQENKQNGEELREKEKEDIEYMELLQNLDTCEDYLSASKVIQHHCIAAGEDYEQNPHYAYAYARAMESGDKLPIALEFYEGAAAGMYDSDERAATLRVQLDDMVATYEEHLYDDVTSLEELREECSTLQGYDQFDYSYNRALLVIYEGMKWDDTTYYFCCDSDNYGDMYMLGNTAFFSGFTEGNIFSTHGDVDEMLALMQEYAAKCSANVVTVSESMLDLMKKKVKLGGTGSTKSDDISIDTLNEGEYWCMGKNDTCTNKTYSPYDFYCSSCDPDGDNIEG